MHHAEVVAHRVGEPYGSLVLAVAVTIIEVGLIVTLMVTSDKDASGLARDTVFAAVMITGGVMAYGYFAARYASEFVPALVLGGAIGTVLVAHALRDRRSFPLVAGGIVVLATFSIVAQVSIGISAAAVHARGPELERYLGWQQSATPEAQSRLVTFSDSLEDDGETDELRIAGDCDALYLNTGDAYEPWATVQARGQAARIRPAGRLRPGHNPF